MNLTPAFFVSALAEYWYVFVILIFLAFLKTPFFKGFIGEVIINITTSLFIDKKKIATKTARNIFIQKSVINQYGKNRPLTSDIPQGFV